MRQSISKLAESLAFGECKLDIRGIQNYLSENLRMVDNEIKMKRNPINYKNRAKAAELALELLKENK